MPTPSKKIHKLNGLKTEIKHKYLHKLITYFQEKNRKHGNRKFAVKPYPY